MRLFYLILLTVMEAPVQAQPDTANLVRYYDGTRTFTLYSKTDTLLISLYPSGKKESQRPLKNQQVTGIYSRWYENGKLMYQREMVKDIPHGTSLYYSPKGTKVAELQFSHGQITDTVFLSRNIHVVLGHITYRSIVYGGMERADGTSNVSDINGAYIYHTMQVIKTDSLSKPERIQFVRTDHRGEFIAIVPVGKMGFFPASVPLEKLNPNEFYPPEQQHMSGEEGWSMNPAVLIISPGVNLYTVLLHHTSVGYAP